MLEALIVTMLILGTIPMILTRPHVGILVWAWIGYMNPHRLSPPWEFAYRAPFALVIGVVTIVALLVAVGRKQESFKFPLKASTVFLILLLLWQVLTTLLALDSSVARVELERTLKIQLIVFMTMMLINDRQRLIQLAWVIAYSIGFYGIKGGLFALATGGNYRIWGPDGSFIQGNNELALAMIMVLPLMWYLRSQVTNKWLKRGILLGVILTVVAVLASYSRGALVAIMAMGFFLVLKSRHRIPLLFTAIVLALAVSFVVPESWKERMSSIGDAVSEEGSDRSFDGRLNAWRFAINLAADRPLNGGGFGSFAPRWFAIYAPNKDPEWFHDAHSIYFEVLGEHGYVGLMLFLGVFVFAWFSGGGAIRKCKDREDLRWAADLIAMTQVGLIGYAVGGIALGLAYFDLPYHLVSIIVMTRVVIEKEIAGQDQPVTLEKVRPILR